MSAEEIRALERRVFEEWNKGKAAAIDAIDEFYAPDYVEHTGTGEDIHDLKDYKQSWDELYTAFPDLHFTIDDMVVEGDKVAVRFTFSGTHKGEFEGIPPTNKKMTMWGIYIDRIAGGKFVESWVRYDTLGLKQQLGLVLAPSQG